MGDVPLGAAEVGTAGFVAYTPSMRSRIIASTELLLLPPVSFPRTAVANASRFILQLAHGPVTW